MIKEGCENKYALLILLIFYWKSQKSKSLDNNNLKWKIRFLGIFFTWNSNGLKSRIIFTAFFDHK